MTMTHTDHPMRHFDRTCPGCAENEMTYELPEPEYLGWDYERLLVKPIRGYTADQLQAAFQAGRDSMKAEVLLKLELMLDYCGGLVNQILTEQIKQIKELK